MGHRLTSIARFALQGLLTGALLAPSTGFAASQSSVNADDQTVHFTPRAEEAETVHFTTQFSASTEQAAAQNDTPEAGGFVVKEEVSWQAAFVSQNAYPRLMADQSYQFTVSVKNVGTASWADDVVFLGTDRPRDRIPGFIREDVVDGNPSGWVAENRIAMLVDEDLGELAGDEDANGLIDPGETATFEFWMSVPEAMVDGVYREYFNLVADGLAWFNDLGIFWTVTVDNQPHARFVDQNAYPPTLMAGDSYEFWVRFENTGLLPWEDDGPTPVHLGTDRSMDRVPGFLREGPAEEDSGWTNHNGNRAKLDRDPDSGDLVGDENGNDQIDPGEIARFRFWYTVPETMESGTYQEYFRPVMDNRDYGWMEDYGVFWANVVNNIAPRPESVTLKPEVNHLQVSWSASPEAESYKLRYRPVGGDFTFLDLPSSQTVANIDLAGGLDYEIGVASVDAEGTSPFTAAVVHVESPEEMEARVAAEAAREEQIAEEERVAEEERRAAEEPVVTGPPAEPEGVARDWRQFWLTLLIILGAAGLATAGYYGYEWWAEARLRPRPTRIEPPRREGPPKPPSGPSARW